MIVKERGKKTEWVHGREWRPGVNFTNVLNAAFMHVSCAPSFLCLHFMFVLYRRKTVGAKVACRMLVKFTPSKGGASCKVFLCEQI
jgi:hypothetical protein